MSHGMLNNATRTIVATLGVIFGISGFGHGFFEALQGSTAPSSLIIHAIGEAHRFWAYGNEPAFTVIPNFLVTGIAAMLVSVAVMVWSVGYLHKRNGPLGFLLLFTLLFLVGGGIGQVVFFTIAWAFATRIDKPLSWWRKVIPVGMRRGLSRLWLPGLILSTVLILYALVVAIFGFVPGISNPDTVTVVMLSSLGAGLVMMLLAFVSGFAHDIAEKEKGAHNAMPASRLIG